MMPGEPGTARSSPSPDEIAKLPYRPGVGLMLLNSAGRVFAGRRIDNPGGAWQMPQGGIDGDETPVEAALRELGEETGIPPTKVSILRESDEWRSYDLPPRLIPKLWGGRWRGQKQRWFALRFHGADADIRLNAVGKPEFSEWTWMSKPDLLRRIVPFKRGVYSRVFAEFADLPD